MNFVYRSYTKLCMFFFSGILIRTDPFIVGTSATLTCTSDVSADQIEWLDSERRVVARVTSMDQLELTFNPVNDSIHNSVYTCRVTKGNDIVGDCIAINATGMSM